MAENMIRTFAAIPVPEDVAAFLGKVGAKRLGKSLNPNTLQRMRWENAGYHITLRFFGDLTLDQLAAIRFGDLLQAKAKPAHEQFQLALGDYGVFPEYGDPEVAWVGVTGDIDAMRRVRTSIDELAEKAGISTEDLWPFHPHITLGRFPRDMGSLEATGARIAVETLDPPEPIEWQVTSISLMESLRTDQGIEYREITSGTLRTPFQWIA